MAVFLGEKESTGYWLNLDTAFVSGENVIVSFSINAMPDPNKPILKMKTYPHVIAAVPHLDKQIQIEFVTK